MLFVTKLYVSLKLCSIIPIVLFFTTWKSKLNGWITILLSPSASFVDFATIYTLPVVGTLNLLLIVNVVGVFWTIEFTSTGNNEIVYFVSGTPVEVQIRAYTEKLEVPSDDILNIASIDTICSPVDLL